jgi:hypothetical protein
MSTDVHNKLTIELLKSATDEELSQLRNLAIATLKYGMGGIILAEPRDDQRVREIANFYREQYPDSDWQDDVEAVTDGLNCQTGLYRGAADISLLVFNYLSIEMRFWTSNSTPHVFLEYFVDRFPRWRVRHDYIYIMAGHEGYVEYDGVEFKSETGELEDQTGPCKVAKMKISDPNVEKFRHVVMKSHSNRTTVQDEEVSF